MSGSECSQATSQSELIRLLQKGASLLSNLLRGGSLGRPIQFQGGKAKPGENAIKEGGQNAQKERENNTKRASSPRRSAASIRIKKKSDSSAKGHKKDGARADQREDRADRGEMQKVAAEVAEYLWKKKNDPSTGP